MGADADAGRKPLIERLRARKDQHRQRGRLYRISFAALGLILVLGGAVLSLPLVPGPGLLLVAIGLAILALESDRAERLLETVLARLDRIGEEAKGMSTTLKVVVAALGLVAVAAGVAAVVVWDVPLIPG